MRSMQRQRGWWQGIALLVFGLLPAGWPGTAVAQTPRAELGRRLQRFELAWQAADAATRAKAVEPMSAAVRSFFALDLASAASHLDQAWYAVRQEGPPDEREQYLLGHELQVGPLVTEAANDELRIAMAPAYPLAGREEGRLPVKLAVLDGGGAAWADTERPLADLLAGVNWTPGDLPEGDLVLVATCMVEGSPVEIARRGIARLPRFRERVAAGPEGGGKSEAAADGEHAPIDPTVAATLESLSELLQAIAEGRPQETDYPAARLLACAERLASQPEGAIAAEARTGDVWLTLAVGRGRVPVRLRAPADAEGPLPVLVLLHGAGGSENMFFETCGAGRAVTLGLDRGWLVVAPRQGIFGLAGGIEGIVEALAAEFPIDRERVFLVGHSMGAMQAARQVSQTPEAVAAAAALGGGGAVPTGEAALQVPWFVAAGEHDFGRRGAEALAQGITAAGGRVISRTFADVEHMVIVQAALDDVFAFLDDVAGGRREGRRWLPR